MQQFWFNVLSKISVQEGDYYRLLTNGDYHITASMDGYLPSTKSVTVKNNPRYGAMVVNFTLQQVSSTHIYYDTFF